MTEIDYAARVQRGIALMDEKWPNWATEIDLDVLDIESGYHCVTAQYAKHFTEDPDATWEDGMEMLGRLPNSYEEHGFIAATMKVDGETITDQASYATLNALWKAEIIRRREAARPEASER